MSRERIIRNRPDRNKFNPDANLPFELRLDDFESAMQDVYDFFFDVNTGLVAKGLDRPCTPPVSRNSETTGSIESVVSPRRRRARRRYAMLRDAESLRWRA